MGTTELAAISGLQKEMATATTLEDVSAVWQLAATA